MTDYFADNPDLKHLKNLPWSYFICFFSYSLILFIEKVAFDSHALIEHEHGDEDHHHHDHEHDHRKQTTESVESVESENEEEEQMKNLLSVQGRIGSIIENEKKEGK